MPEGHKGLTARGNLYLLTGRADEAKVVFDMALEASKDKKQRDIAAEGVARSLRAKYWSLGEATRYSCNVGAVHALMKVTCVSRDQQH